MAPARGGQTHDDLTLTHSSHKNDSMPSTGNSGRVRQPGMSATSYFLLAAQLLSLGHLLVVSHVTCPEHGDVIHSGQPRELLSARPIVDEGLSSLRSIAAAAPRAENGHDHCLICTITHERFALLPPANHCMASIELAVPFVSPSDAGPFAPVALIVFAPKNSPPAA